MNNDTSLSLLISRINGISLKWAEKNGINPYKLKPLYSLYLKPSMTQKQISEYCSLPKQTVNNAIRDMKKQGFVFLEPLADDKREKRICITESGKEYLEKTTAPAVDLENRVIKRMGKEAYESLIYGLNEYANAMMEEENK